MGLKEEIKERALTAGFDLVGVSDIEGVERLGPMPERRLRSPIEVLPGARSLLILGIAVKDEAMNLSVSGASAGGIFEATLYYNFYYEITETRAWRLLRWLSEKSGVRGIPTHSIHIKPAAVLAGLGFIGHNTQVITEKYGPRVRFVALLLDEEIEPDEPFTRDLCGEQPLCSEGSLCVGACPYRAIIPGPSRGVPLGEKVNIDRCVVSHVSDIEIDKKWERFIRRVSDRGFLECTLCNLACPYGAE